MLVVTTADPGTLAERLDHRAGQLMDSGYHVIPLQLSLAAHRCDPSHSRYAIQAMGLYTELGRTDQAEELRNRLDSNLGPFVELVRLENPNQERFSEVLYAQASPVVEPASAAVESQETPVAPVEAQPEPAVDQIVQAVFFGTMMMPEPE